MAMRDNIEKLVARAQKETDPEVLERIASRLYDALIDKAQDLRKHAVSSPSRENELKRKKGANGS
jgi:hypothetical protein